ncbi:MAG: hypothetical protein OH338_01990 [Candidatus Parvarchaeota archaeon]|jgi:hypothetical protein|nr:hypothetical protein [Candidatus Parvarchaeota archaeon]MCW1294318.1 hypothetical protein [Candidatus Parvarchaeum tengchongense]MCL4373235.1 hypothetical protein [Candidatus Parvarchaeota archaeon]MCL4376035.1 hypothetical protein [Candidatus Parvarchaeota archaeon]MCL4398649.1 hypothetical protein [Candidatus Parvarchaeota archaeon]
MNSKGQMPITEIIAIILAIIVLFAGIIIGLIFTGAGSTIAKDMTSVFSFSWLYGKGI